MEKSGRTVRISRGCSLEDAEEVLRQKIRDVWLAGFSHLAIQVEAIEDESKTRWMRSVCQDEWLHLCRLATECAYPHRADVVYRDQHGSEPIAILGY